MSEIVIWKNYWSYRHVIVRVPHTKHVLAISLGGKTDKSQLFNL